MFATTAIALAPSNNQAFGSRRSFLSGVTSAGAAVIASNTLMPEQASAAIAKTGAASVFTGEYDDPNHPGCLRQVKVIGPPLRADGTRSAYPIVEVKGYDGKDGAKMCTDRPTRADLWSVQGKLLNNNEARLDFSPKGGPANLLAKWEDGGIVFPDGNKWTKVVRGTADRYPKDMSTLKSID